MCCCRRPPSASTCRSGSCWWSAGPRWRCCAGGEGPGGDRRAVNRHRVTTLHFVPSMLDAFRRTWRSTGAGGAASLRRVFVGGELLARQIHRFRDVLGGGAVEPLQAGATVDVSCFDCGGGTGAECRRPSIDNTSLFVLDPALTPLPIGVTGGCDRRNGPGADIWAISAHADRSVRSVRREYACPTGDRGRFGLDRQLHFLGRADAQVKVRARSGTR